MQFLYSVAMVAGSLLLLPFFLLRSLAGKETFNHLRERFGGSHQSGDPDPPPGSIWIHAASVGEVQVARLLITRLRERVPDRRIVLSVTTQTGRSVARKSIGSEVADLFYFPLDFRFAVRRALRRIRPVMFIAIETEIWPQFLRECRRFGIHYGIVNGRISRKSFGRYRLIRPLLAPGLSGMSFLFMQSEKEAERIQALGAPAHRIRITGNLKSDFSPNEPERNRLRKYFGVGKEDPVFVAGSTAPGEERILLRAFREARERIPLLRLILAPRHPERFDEVFQLLQEERIPALRRTDRRYTVGEPWEVFLLDSLGELPHVYGLATVAFVGGSLVPKGGHNPVEPAAWGKPVLFGPYMENFQPIARELQETGGALLVTGWEDLRSALLRLLVDPETYRQAAAGAKRWADRHRGALEKTCQNLAGILGSSEAGPEGAGMKQAFLQRKSLLSSMMAPLSWPYGSFMAYRNRRYERPGSTERAPIPVLSVGNLAVGGTGKTPVTIGLARILLAEGWRPAIISRGYGRKGRSRELRAIRTADGGSLPRADRLGDEPALMARRMPEIPIIVCSDRLRAVRHAWERFGAEVALLDDGFQHRRLHRDVDLLLVDSMNPFGNGRLLPAGPLRESMRGIGRASAVLLTRWNLASPGRDLIGTVRRWAGPKTPIFRCCQKSVGLLGPMEGKRQELEHLSGVPVLAFAGIGNPASFDAELLRCRFQVTGILHFRDHHPYSNTDRNRILRAAARTGAEALLTTEKDWVRFPVEGCPLPLYALEVTQEPMEREDFIQFLRAALPEPPATGRLLAGEQR